VNRHVARLSGLFFVVSLACDIGPESVDGNGNAVSTPAESGLEVAGASAPRQTRTIGPAWRALAVGGDAAAVWDGASWTGHSIPGGLWGGEDSFNRVVWSGSLLMAMGRSSFGPPVVATSRDGVSWDNKGPIWFGEVLEGLTWAGTSFVAVGTFDGFQAISFTSADGTSPWIGPAYAPFGARGFNSVAWNGAVLVASGDWNDLPPPWEALVPIVATSTDLASWTVHPMPPPFSRMSITAAGSTFLAVGVDSASSCVFGRSSDGQSWVAQAIPNATECFAAAATSGSEFVVLGTSSGAIAAFVSPDGITWEGPFSIPSVLFGAITWNGSQYVMVGREGLSGDTLSATSPDGRTWTAPVSVPLYPAGLPGSLVSFVLPPRVDAASPGSGLTPGGVPVRITGDFFQTGATVTFGGTPARRANVVSATTLWAVPPAHDPGAVDITVTNPDGQTASLGGAYLYSAPPPR
jgi:hypothetical protein